MSNAGYVYILANSSMPNLVKIGKTTRCPEQRAKELSSGTGIASPFFVAYHSYFNDCSFVEKYLHKNLEDMRYSSNREFFNLPIKDAVDHLISASSKFPYHEKDSSISSNEDDTLDDNLGEEAFKQAQLGYQSFEDQVELYEKAKELGCIKSYKELGKLYFEYTFGDDDNEEKGIDYLLSGYSNGDPFCFAELALYYHDSEESIKMIQGDDYIYDEDYSVEGFWEGYFDDYPSKGESIYSKEVFLKNTKDAAFNYIQYSIYSERYMKYKNHVINFVHEYIDRCIKEMKLHIDHIAEDYFVVIAQYKLDLNKFYLNGVLNEFSTYLNEDTKKTIKSLI